nr:unnamed protein product [Spirometra erinaceieuropaei]
MLKEVQWHQTTVECRNCLLEHHQAFEKRRVCLRLLFQILNRIAPQARRSGPVPSISGLVFAKHSLEQTKIRRFSSLERTDTRDFSQMPDDSPADNCDIPRSSEFEQRPRKVQDVGQIF